MTDDVKYMERALDLAVLGREWVSPNPMVGCVIVHNNQIIGEGFHRKYGESHAEVIAIESVEDKSRLSESTVYVTLEPCSHHGKTPPCSDLLIHHKVKRVVICCDDPSPNISGIARLKEAGIEVESGLLKERGLEINKRFFKAQETGLPYIILKWAETADGFIAHEDGRPEKITNSTTNISVHRWRAEEDAILVGKNTALNDNPRLNVRNWMDGKDPVRVVLDTHLKIDSDKNIFDNSQPTIVFNAMKNEKSGNTEWIKETDLTEVFKTLKKKGINSVLVEGGRQVHNSLISAGMFDEIRLLKSPKTLGKGIFAPTLPQGITLTNITDILGDKIFFYIIKKGTRPFLIL